MSDLTDNIDKLKAALEAGTPGNYVDTQTAALKILGIDTSTWTEFGDFFNKPLSKSLIFQGMPDEDLARGWYLPAAFMSVVSVDREKAIHALRCDLRKLLHHSVGVKAFLALPSVVELASYPREGEIPDTTMVVDLKGGIPAKRRYAAFCFLHGFVRSAMGPMNLDLKGLKELGCSSAVQEGEVGQNVDGPFNPFASPELTTQQKMAMLQAEVDADPDMTPGEKQIHRDALAADSQENQDSLYQDFVKPLPPDLGDIVELDKTKKTQLTITNVKDPVQVLAYMHPEFAQAAARVGADLTRPAGRELEEMRKYFGQGSGTYLVTVDFQVARTQAFKLDARAQKKITKALNEKPKRKAKKPAKRSKR